MAIVDTINSIKTNIENAYDTILEKGGTIPTNKNIENLSDSINSISGGGESGESWGLNRNMVVSSTPTNYQNLIGGFLTKFPKELSSKLDFTTHNSLAHSFYNNLSIEEVDFSDVDLSSVTNLEYMFYTCTNLKTVKFTNNNTSSLINMRYFLYNCTNLQEIDLSGLDTSRVTNFSYSFYRVAGIKEIDLSFIDFSNATDIGYMFDGNSTQNLNTITRIDLKNKSIPRVTRIEYCFRRMYKLAYLDISSFEFTNIANSTGIFVNCGTQCSINDGAYANGIPYVYVKDETARNWVLSLSTTSSRPSSWTTANVIIAGSEQDTRTN